MKDYNVKVLLPMWYGPSLTYRVKARDEEDAEARATDMAFELDPAMADLIESFEITDC